MTKIAIIETGGKQYVVFEGQKLEVEKLSQKTGLPAQAGLPAQTEVKLAFDTLLSADENKIEVGKPYVPKKVEAELLGQKRAKKIKILRYHSKTRHRRRKGHRQELSVVKILKI